MGIGLIMYVEKVVRVTLCARLVVPELLATLSLPLQMLVDVREVAAVASPVAVVVVAVLLL